jgi:biopolymer transport protein ExbD
MAASMSSGFGDEEGVISDINVTPLVDVVLVLLIVFMITVPAIVASAPVKVDLPETSAAKSEGSPTPAKLEIFVRREPGAGGEIVAYVGPQFVRLEELQRALQAMPLPPRTDPVKIAAEKGLPYGQVVRVIDIVGSLGFKKIALDTQHVDRAP